MNTNSHEFSHLWSSRAKWFPLCGSEGYALRVDVSVRRGAFMEKKTGSGWFRQPVSLNALRATECYLVTLTRVTGPSRPECSKGESAR